MCFMPNLFSTFHYWVLGILRSAQNDINPVFSTLVDYVTPKQVQGDGLLLTN